MVVREFFVCSYLFVLIQKVPKKSRPTPIGLKYLAVLFLSAKHAKIHSLIFNTYNLLLSVEFASSGLPTKSTPGFLAPIDNGRELPNGIGERMRFL